MDENRDSGDLVMAPGTYIYMQDVGKGSIKVCSGPMVVSASGQQRPVVYDPTQGRFIAVARLEEAVRQAAIAVEGYYLVLLNPSSNHNQPPEGESALPPELTVGRKVNIPGPEMFALWPGQVAEGVRGHHLHYNQYLLVRVYNEEEARKNWTRAVVKLTSPAEGDEAEVASASTGTAPEDLTVGKLLIIRGDQVSFYMPPTGICVVQDDDGKYVRDALTLERLEYCVLVDEDGNKRYEIGPQVVFPAPTEHFRYRNDQKGRRNTKFRAIELNELQGLHVKVIAPYTNEEGKERKLGEERFITGNDTAIFYPREGLSIIKYDGQTKHFATAIPTGEARYVMNRMTGEIKTEHGPQMLLPDPRKEVIVRRVLSDKQVECWYPDNIEALRYNQMLREIMATSPTVRQGVVSEGDFERSMKKGARGGPISSTKSPMGEAVMYAASVDGMEGSMVGAGQQDMAGDEFSRASSYTQPRTVTLRTKYEGVPAIDIWTGYAVKVVSKTGNRRVEVGPQTILPSYDESLEVMELSTGKPKTTDNLLKTAYLRVKNNKISDLVEVETRDHVRIRLKLSHRVSFEGDPEQWFDVENYIKFLCDHVRSVLKGAVKRVTVESFYETAVDFVRDTILGVSEEGKTRPGMTFKENGMHVVDIEVLKIQIVDENVAQLLATAQHDVVAGNIMLDKEKRELLLTQERERVARERRTAEHETVVFTLNIQSQEIAAQLKVELDRIQSKFRQHEEQAAAITAREALTDVEYKAKLDRERAADELRLNTRKTEIDLDRQTLEAEAESVVKRFAALQPRFTEALLALRDSETMKVVAEAWSMNRVVGGASVADALGNVFKNTPLGGIAARLANGNGDATISPKPPTRPQTSA